jgi:hypothetical protein
MPAARPPPSAPPVRTQPQPPPEGPQVDAPVPAPPPAASSTGRKTAKKRKPAGEAGAAADEPLKKRRSSKIVPPDGIVSQHKGVSWVQKVKKWQASIWLMPVAGEPGSKGKTVFLGYWDTEQKALEIYSEALTARQAGQPIPEHLLRKKNLTSKHFGVSLIRRTGRYTAAIRFEGKQNYIGTYETEELAKAAYDRAAKQIEDTVRRARISFFVVVSARSGCFRRCALKFSLTDILWLPLRQGTFTSDARPSKSKYRGVSFNAKNGWGASLQHKGVRKFCGWHPTEEAAKAAYDTEALKQNLDNRVSSSGGARDAPPS